MDPERLYDNRTAAMLLAVASLILLANGVFNVEQFAVQYGLGVGAALQGGAYNISVIPGLQPVVLQAKAIYQSLLEGFLLSGIGLAMFAISFPLLLFGPNRQERHMRTYVPFHLMLAFIYTVLLLIIHVAFAPDLYVAYVALAACFVLDAYLIYVGRAMLSGRAVRRGIGLYPSTPYSNMINLREKLFGSLSGRVGIVDRHFNSTAMANLHRLMPTADPGIKSLSVLTSTEMLDSRFSSNYFDLKEELRNEGIELEVRIMKAEDAVAQHERFILDEGNAYKIPPLNIIHKKSEHIVRMDQRDARRRFDYLHHNAVKIENYLEKKGRE